MRVKRDLILRVAAMARLNLSDEEIDEFLPQLNEIIAVFEKLNEIDTNNVEPSFHPVKQENVLREDVPEDCLDTVQALANSKHKREGYFMGPKVV